MTQTTNSIHVPIAEEFNHLNIRYRKIVFSDGELYFCTLTGGLTFDLFVGTDGLVRVWRFVSSVPVCKAGACIEYRKPEYPHMSLGFEVTEDGDLCFYAEQGIDANDSQKEHRVTKLIRNYAGIISTVNFSNFKM